MPLQVGENLPPPQSLLDEKTLSINFLKNSITFVNIVAASIAGLPVTHINNPRWNMVSKEVVGHHKIQEFLAKDKGLDAATFCTPPPHSTLQS
ncbi:MAG: hypothetical protein QXM16_01190 [Nitrososphaerota archaeon]